MKKLCLIFIFYLISFVIGINAQNKDTVDLFDASFMELLDYKVVTLAKLPEKLLETSTSINVVSREEIEFLNFNTLQELLEYITGMSSINGEANFFTTTTIRGNTLVNYNTNTLLLFDGVPILNAYHGSFDFLSIPLSSIEKIEIVKGANSVLYGSNAINAVINIISKKKDELDQHPLSASGKLKVGSYNNLHNQSAILYNRNKIYFSLFADINYFDGENLTYSDEAGNKLSFKKELKASSVASNLTYGEFTAHFQFYNRAEDAIRTRKFQRIYISADDTIGYLVTEPNHELMSVSSLAYNHSFTDKTSLHIRSNYNKWHNIKELPDGSWDYSASGLYNDVEFSYIHSDKWKNIVGLSYNYFIGRRYKSKYKQYDVGKDNVWTNEFAIYLNGNIAFANKWNFFYGGRYFVSKYSDIILDNFSPRLALTYRPTESISFKLIYGESFRVPTYFEKEVFSHKVIGNPNLLPERSQSYDFVAMWIHKGFQIDVNTYHNKIYDQIKRVDSPENPDMKKNMNTNTSAYTGVEINTKLIIKKYFRAFAGYSFARAYDVAKLNSLPFTYSHMLNFGFNWKVISRLDFSSSYKYLSKWGDAPAYNLLNLGLNLKPFKNTDFNMELKADNILDTKVLRPEIARVREEVPTYPLMMSRRFFMGVSFRF